MPANQLPVQQIGDKHKLLGLDHLRAFAITYVVLFHYQFFGHPAWVNTIASFGWTGVDLFFVLSGFLISGQLFAAIAKGKAISLKEFFVKRFFRIIPPFLVVVILYGIFPILREREHMAPLWQYLTFTLNLNLDLKQIGTFTHSWSLCVEEQFYLVLPLMFMLSNYFKAGKKVGYFIAALFIGGVLIRLFLWHKFASPHLNSDDFGVIYNRYIYYPTYNRLDSLLVGVSIAGLITFYPAFKTLTNRYSNELMILGASLWILAYYLCTPQQTFTTAIFGFALIAIALGLILTAMVSPSFILYKVKSSIISAMATLSYSIYLIHKMVIHVVQHLLDGKINKDSNLMMLICLASVIVGALAMRYVIEKPAMSVRDKILKRL